MAHIFIDLDGVIADFVTAIAELMAPNQTDVQLVRRGRDIWPNEHPFKQLELALDVPAEEMWETIYNAGEKFWSQMKPFPWALKLWNDLNSLGCETSILSAPGQGGAGITSAAGKQAFVMRVLGFGAQQRLILCPSKQKYLMAQPGRVLIDDLDTTCAKWDAHGGRAVRFPSLQFDGQHPTSNEINRIVQAVATYCAAW